jgi:hypothetical protein
MDDNTNNFPDPLPPIPRRNIPRVAIMCVSRGEIQLETVKSMLVVNSSPLVDSTIVLMPNGPYMDMGRNRAVEQFVVNPSLASFDWLLFLDSDVEFTPQDVVTVTSTPHAIVGGAYTSYHGGKQFVVAYNFGPGIHGPNTLLDLTVDELDAMPPTPTPIDAIGTGFLAIHRTAIDRFAEFYASPQPWFAELTVSPDPSDESTSQITGIHLGEDLTFCLRANAINIPVHIHPLVRLNHFKTYGIVMPPHPSLTPSTTPSTTLSDPTA